MKTNGARLHGGILPLWQRARCGPKTSFRLPVIDPVSGPSATTGEVGLNSWQFVAGEINAAGGLKL
jgi:hypothetical protein